MSTTITGMAGLSREQPLMPGAFGPEDYIDFYENPFGVLDGSETSGEKQEQRVSWAVKVHGTASAWRGLSPFTSEGPLGTVNAVLHPVTGARPAFRRYQPGLARSYRAEITHSKHSLPWKGMW